MQISWTPPPPREGWRGWWDRLIGPGATAAEEWLQLLGGLALSGLALLSFWLRFPGEPTLAQTLVVALLALDLSGGVVTNATATAKRWYHREGQGWRQHLGFVAPHGLHLALLGWLLPGVAWWWLALLYGYLLAATLLIARTPLALQRPVALTCYAAALLLCGMLGPLPGLEWVAPLLLLKLLVCHLVREAPFRPDGEAPQAHA